MIDGGKLEAQLVRESHLREPEKRGEPYCTRSQFIRYLDVAGRWVAEVHQYLRPDGTLGASGKPDPKRLRFGNRVFAVRARPAT